MSARPARSAKGADRRPRVTTAKRPAPKRRGSALDRAVAQIPVPRDALRTMGNWTLGLLVFGGLVMGVVAMGIPQMAWAATAGAIGEAGFTVRHVEILNRKRADADVVYDIAMSQQSRAMPLVDLTGTRSELMKLGWIADARISRRLPDTLVVDIVERVPAAIWQYRGRLVLVDHLGTEIAPVDDRAMPDLPVVVGPVARRQVEALTALLDTQPALKPLITASVWQGSRRWDIIFQSGETLKLPEGDGEAIKALAWFARKDKQNHLLGRGIVGIDMRDPTRTVVRMAREPGGQIEAPAPPPAPAAQASPPALQTAPVSAPVSPPANTVTT